MKKVLILIIFIITAFISAPAQDTLWTQTYGTANNDMGHFIQQTADDGFIIVGHTWISNWDIYLVKTDTLGGIMWTGSFGGPYTEFGYSVRQIASGDYIVVGRTQSYGTGLEDVYLLKIDADGDTVWTRTYGGIGYESGNSLVETPDNGYLIAGSTDSYGAGGSDLYLIKTSIRGDTLWTRTYGGGLDDEAQCIISAAAGGYMIVGTTESFGSGGKDIWILKINGSGDTLWSRTFGGDGHEFGYSVAAAYNGYFLTGSTNSFGAGVEDVYTVRIDENGDSLWAYTYGGANVDIGRGIQLTSDGGCFISGYTNSEGAGDYDVYLIKTDSNGIAEWDTTYGGTDDDKSYAIQATDDGGYVIVGYTASRGAGGRDFWLLRMLSYNCLETEAVCHTPIVPNIGGYLIWELNVTNCGSSPAPVWVERRPIVGDCANGTPYLPLHTSYLVTDNLDPEATFTGYYYIRMTNVTGITLAALELAVGPADGEWIGGDCFEFYFAYPGYRNDGRPDFGQWSDIYELGNDNLITIPGSYALFRNYPNPFNAETTIPFYLAEPTAVEIEIYDIAGRLVDILYDGYSAEGLHSVTWNALGYASGIYFCRMKTVSGSRTVKMVLVK